MISFRYSPAGLLPRLLAVLIVCLLPGAVFADSVTFRNECKGLVVVVQSASMARGVMRRDKPVTLRYGDVSPKLPLDTEKLITVYDQRSTTRILFQGSLKASPVDLYYSIVPDTNPARVRMQSRPAPGSGAMPGPGSP
jgi:hypothetical protein